VARILEEAREELRELAQEQSQGGVRPRAAGPELDV